ncbi:MAG: hypothetical protein KJ811_02880 [Candidatus Margulisbacteria bacterium]|nr:hypothetical protein [Candidatus Margulisiibacteriota bacterium]
MLNYKIVSARITEISAGSRSFVHAWGQARRLWGEVALRSPKLLETEADLAQYEMSGEIGGFSIPTKETFINLVKFMEQFGPFEAEHYNHLRTKTLERLEKIDERKATATQNIINWLDQRIETGEMTRAEAAVHLFMIVLMGHEIGHHKMIPYDFKRSLLLQEAAAKITGDRGKANHITNQYEDILINLALAEVNGLPVEALYQRITEKNEGISPLWQIYMRVYEKLLDVEILPKVGIPAEMEADADRVVNIIRESRPSNYLQKVQEFATIFNKYMTDQDMSVPIPLDGEVKSKAPAEQPGRKASAKKAAEGLGKRQKGEPGQGQIRPIKEYQEMMTASGIASNVKEATIMYYLDLASDLSVKFPLYPKMAGEEVIEGVALWDPSEHDVAELDLPLSYQMGPTIPGVTTLMRTKVEGYDTKAGFETPNLVVYVDASGSRPNPNETLSHPVLGATIWIQSAINAGAKVRVVVFDSRKKYNAMQGFTRDINEAMQHILTYGPSEPTTTFPLEDLKELYDNEEYKREPLRMVTIYDDEVSYMLSDEFNGGSGEDLLRQIQAEGRGGGDFLLGCGESETTKRLRDLGFQVHLMRNWGEIAKAAANSAEAIYDPYRHLQKLQQEVYNT